MPLDCTSEAGQKAVRAQLDRILKSGPFERSQRRQRFLEYIVDETLAGRGDRIKGYNIALEVFKRPATFDANIDPMVRVEAGRLARPAARILRGRGQERSRSHRAAEGQLRRRSSSGRRRRPIGRPSPREEATAGSAQSVCASPDRTRGRATGRGECAA